MITLSKTVALTTFVAIGLSAGGASAGQRAAVPDVAVPEVAVPVQGGLDGCYRISQSLYGPYRMSFCLDNGQGSYRVTGGGLDCRGGIDANAYGRRVDIALSYSQCGRGTAWTADNLYCQAVFSGGGYGGGYGYRRGLGTGSDGDAVGGYGGPQDAPGGRLAVPEIAVPDVAVPVPVPAYIASLRCTYDPAVGGYPRLTVTARRVS
jgi:hypothetical protein